MSTDTIETLAQEEAEGTENGHYSCLSSVTSGENRIGSLSVQSVISVVKMSDFGV